LFMMPQVCLIGIGDRVMAGMPCDEAKAAVSKRHHPHTPPVTEGVRRVVSGYTYADLDKVAKRKSEERFLASIERARGKRLGWLDRLLWRWFRLVC